MVDLIIHARFGPILSRLTLSLFAMPSVGPGTFATLVSPTHEETGELAG